METKVETYSKFRFKYVLKISTLICLEIFKIPIYWPFIFLFSVAKLLLPIMRRPRDTRECCNYPWPAIAKVFLVTCKTYLMLNFESRITYMSNYT